MKSKEWWRDTANHIWRTYFALVRDGFEWDKLSDPEKRFYALSHHVFRTEFVKSDQDILRMYFTTRWGDDQFEVEEYAKKTGTPEKVIWMVIRRANRTIMEACGLLEKKDDGRKGDNDAEA